MTFSQVLILQINFTGYCFFPIPELKRMNLTVVSWLVRLNIRISFGGQKAEKGWKKGKKDCSPELITTLGLLGTGRQTNKPTVNIITTVSPLKWWQTKMRTKRVIINNKHHYQHKSNIDWLKQQQQQTNKSNVFHCKMWNPIHKDQRLTRNVT